MTAFSTYTDQQLLEAIRKSNETAFAEFYNRHWRKVYAMAYDRIQSRSVAEEIVQELFISLWNKRANLFITYVSSYLYQAVKSKVLNHIEAKLVHEKYWDYYKRYVPRHENSTDRIVHFNDLMEVIEHGMELLPEKSKKVFRLNRLEGQSIPEIARLLKLSEKAVQYHLTRSLRKLRLHLKDYILAIAIVASFLD